MSYFLGKMEYICGNTGIMKKKWGEWNNGKMEYCETLRTCDYVIFIL
jgi:hypothetical protein